MRAAATATAPVAAISRSIRDEAGQERGCDSGKEQGYGEQDRRADVGLCGLVRFLTLPARLFCRCYRFVVVGELFGEIVLVLEHSDRCVARLRGCFPTVEER